MKTEADVVQRLRYVSKLLLLQDFQRIEEQKKRNPPGVFCDVPVGKENAMVRGNIIACLEEQDIIRHTLAPKPIRDAEGKHIDIFSERFPHFLSSLLDKRSDRARIVSRDHANIARLLADIAIKNYTEPAMKALQDLVPNPFNKDPFLKEYFRKNDEKHMQYIDDKTVFQCLLGNAYTGNESLRITSSLFLALATGKRILCTKQRVLEQPAYDSPENTVLDKRGNSMTVRYSRLGTGEILQIGPRGLEWRGRLKIDEGADEKYHFGYVHEENGKLLPVVFETVTSQYDPSLRRVIDVQVPALLLEESVQMYDVDG